jgi:hypothetical protein
VPSRIGTHQRACMSASGTAGVRTGPVAVANRIRATSATASGPTVRCRIVCARTVSTSPWTLHHSGRCRPSSISTAWPSDAANWSTAACTCPESGTRPPSPFDNRRKTRAGLP